MSLAVLRLAATAVVAIGAAAGAIAVDDEPASTGAPPPSTPDDGAAAALVREGRTVFVAKGCVVCHERYGTGPSLAGIDERAAGRVEGLDADAYLRQSIRSPRAYLVDGYGEPFVMPRLDVTQRELDALVAYLHTS